MAREGPLEHQQGQGSPCLQELPTNGEKMELEN
jgi:hypothetical protein